jgi:hypothetical protein
MKASLALTLASVALAVNPHPWIDYLPWERPGDGDVRGPCPMLNSLANHGIIPHDGRGISRQIALRALDETLNISEEIGNFLFDQAIVTNPAPNATVFSLEDLGRHNILEHDASLSRSDYYFTNDSVSFHQPSYDETRAHWTEDMIDVQQAADARWSRLQTSNATNPDFDLSDLGFNFGVGETAAYIIVLGDRVTGTVPRAWVQYLFENERLPLSLGWKPVETAIYMADLISMIGLVLDATPEVPTSYKDGTVRKARSRSIHGGMLA